MLTQFESDCTLINLYFQNHLDQEERRCVRKITSWEKVYFVEFYWGNSTFVSKKAELLGQIIVQVPADLIREFCDPVIFKQATTNQRKKLKNKATNRWTKQQHNQWIESRELQVRYYWGYKQYSSSGKSEETVEAMAAFAALGLSPFALTTAVKKAFRDLALRFHPDRGGYEETFRFLRQIYQKALLYADDYLSVSTAEVF